MKSKNYVSPSICVLEVEMEMVLSAGSSGGNVYTNTIDMQIDTVSGIITGEAKGYDVSDFGGIEWDE